MLIARGDKGPQVSTLKSYLKKLGYPLSDIGQNKGIFGLKVEYAVADFQDRYGLEETGIVDQVTFDAIVKAANEATTPNVPVQAENPAYKEAQKYKGQGESNKGFVAFMSKFWPKTGLSNYKTIIGSSFAWCALFIVAMNSEVGQKYLPSAGAKAQGKYGVEIVWQQNGVPRGAVVHVNHLAKNAKTWEEHAKLCKSGSSNHVGFADGDCAADDYFLPDVEMYKDKDGHYRAKALAKKGSVIAILGGNQGNMVKRSVYDAREICEVRWPTEIALPGKIAKSKDCGGKSSGPESTR